MNFTIFAVKGSGTEIFVNWLANQIEDVTVYKNVHVTPDGRCLSKDKDTKTWGTGKHIIQVIQDTHLCNAPGTLVLVNDIMDTMAARQWRWKLPITGIERDLWHEHAQHDHINMRQFFSSATYRSQLAKQLGPGPESDPYDVEAAAAQYFDDNETGHCWLFDDATQELNHKLFGRRFEFPTDRQDLNVLKNYRPMDSRVHEGTALYALGEFEKAKPFFELSPLNKAITHTALREFDEAEAIYKRHDLWKLPKAATDYALMLMYQGRHEEAWQHYEMRLQAWSQMYSAIMEEFGRGTIPRPYTKLDGKHLLVWLEGGLGDNLQFLRFIPQIIDRHDCKITVAAHPSAVQFLRMVTPYEIVDKRKAKLVDYWLPIQSAMLFLQDFTIPKPFIEFHEKAELPPGPKVGLCWQGNPNHVNDDWRSVNVEFFRPLADQFTLVNLQEQSEYEIPMVNPPIRTFLELVKVVNACDVVVSVDSAPGHVAGVLGKKCLVCLCWRADARWTWQGERTPWYPNHRLIRQPKMWDWESVVEQVGERLRKWA